jgi:tripartite-type tricarboxylate transporter receptor subunit TctC
MTARALLVAAIMIAAPAHAADFYAGKTVDIVVGGDVGGGYDTYARLIARHLGRHIPGHPTIVVKNMPGAGSYRAAAFLSAIAPKDGTVIGVLYPGAVIGPLLDDKPAPFDPVKFQYIASAVRSLRVCATHQTSRIKTYQDALTAKTMIGASAAGGSASDYARLHNYVAGAKFEVVAGYKGSADILLAMERGEVDGICGIDISSLRAQRPDWFRDSQVNMLVQDGFEPDPELTRQGVPKIWDHVKGEDERRVAELVISQQAVGRPYLAPPGIPAEQLRILRAGFAAVLADPALLADAEKSRVEISPTPGDTVQRLVDGIYAMPKPVVDRAKRVIKP